MEVKVTKLRKVLSRVDIHELNIFYTQQRPNTMCFHFYVVFCFSLISFSSLSFFYNKIFVTFSTFSHFPFFVENFGPLITPISA